MTITQIILGLTFIVSIISFNNQNLFERLKHHPYSEDKKKEFYRFFTAGFVHGSWIHLGINMFVLWEFGRIVEFDMVRMFGSPNGRLFFLVVYLVTIILANIPSYLSHRSNPYFASIGASGAIAGLLFIYAFMHPWHKLYLYGILPIYAVVGAVAYLFYSSWASKNKSDHIDHSAHFYGAVLGLALFILLRPSLINEFIHKLTTEFPF